MLTFWAICDIMSTLNQSQKQGGDKMIWEEMSYNRLSDCFSFAEDLEHDKPITKKTKNKKSQANQTLEENTKEEKEEK